MRTTWYNKQNKSDDDDIFLVASIAPEKFHSRPFSNSNFEVLEYVLSQQITTMNECRHPSKYFEITFITFHTLSNQREFGCLFISSSFFLLVYSSASVQNSILRWRSKSRNHRILHYKAIWMIAHNVNGLLKICVCVFEMFRVISRMLKS